MKITALRILPTFAIARVGSADEPLDNYTVREDPQHPLGFRKIEGAESLDVDGEGAARPRKPDGAPIEFKKANLIRPVAPFLEVWAATDDKPGELQPLTLDLLRASHGGALTLGSLSWSANVANRKVYRRTGDRKDIVKARLERFSGHTPQKLKGYCTNFISRSDYIDFGNVQFIKPTKECPQIRLRFTPGKGNIYGPPETLKKDEKRYVVDPKRAIYKPTGKWLRYAERMHNGRREFRNGADGQWQPQYNDTMPSSLYAIFPPAPSWQQPEDLAESRGYLDDICDGFVDVALELPGGEAPLTARARICSAPPAPVPDSYFVRTLADDLEQVIHGPALPPETPLIDIRDGAEEIIRRAYETVRFLNVELMNGNRYKGLHPLTLDTMPELEAAEVSYLPVRPIMAPATVDTMTILALHEHIFAALRSGAAPWFMETIRLPHEASDYTDYGRRKMPALMVGADENYLALTYRQIDTLRKSSDTSLFGTQDNQPRTDRTALTPRNLSAQLNYKAAGNPESTRLDTAIANCCPGLETDFRAVWRRIFEGIVLREHDNLVMDADDTHKDLVGHRLLKVDDYFVMAEMKGPALSELGTDITVRNEESPHGLAPLEWSNRLAHIVNREVSPGRFQRKTQVTCYFSKKRAKAFQVPWSDDPSTYIERVFKVRPFFEGDTAVISEALAEPGELTQGLCSPWQNDFRECSCYYWASARPDYVNMEAGPNGLSRGDNWFQKTRTRDYVPDDYVDPRLVLYDDLFHDWEKWIRFQIGGRDAPGEEP